MRPPLILPTLHVINNESPLKGSEMSTEERHRIIKDLKTRKI